MVEVPAKAPQHRISAGLANLLDTSVDAIAVFSPDLRHVYCNDAVCRILQLARDRILGRRFDELPMTPSNADRMQAAVRRVFETGAPYRIEVRSTPRPTRPTRVSDIAYYPERGPDGTVELVVGVTRDITDLRFAEERSRATAERLEILLDTVGVAIVGVDRARNVRFTNHHAQALLGAHAGAASPIGMALEHLVGPALAPALGAGVSAVLQTGDAVVHEADVVVAGAPQRLIIQIRPERGERGTIDGAVLVARDITLERRREAMAQVSERLAALGRVTTKLAQEIVNPLSLVYGNLDQMRRELDRLVRVDDRMGPLLADVRDMLADAQAGAERIRHVLDDIGALARTSSDTPERVDLAEVVGQVVATLDPILSGRAPLALDIAPVPLVAARRARVVQVVATLVQGALAARPDVPAAAGVDPLGVSVARDGHYAVLVIRDAVAPAVDDLPLMIVHGIVTGLGGSLLVDPGPGERATVTVRLPIATA